MNLDEAVREAKVRAGLSPDEKHLPKLFVDHLDPEWRMPFWRRQIEMVVASEMGKKP